MASRFGLARMARLTRRQLIAFALISAALNGLVTASVGAWLAQTYAGIQQRRGAVERLSHLVYERRTRAGMVISSIRRNAPLDELKTRKSAYDETFVEWNKTVRLNMFAIREVMGEGNLSQLERDFEDWLVGPFARIDTCLTRAYDMKLAGQDALPLLETCQMAMNHQLVLDCGSSFTNELFNLTRLSFWPLGGVGAKERDVARARIQKGCTPPAPP